MYGTADDSSPPTAHTVPRADIPHTTATLSRTPRIPYQVSLGALPGSMAFTSFSRSYCYTGTRDLSAPSE